MKWYEGNIAEAIQKSKQEGAVFGVGIFGDDENSNSLESSLCSANVQNTLTTGKFVCIRIAANSPEHRQFSQIYSNAPSPSIYLIGERGATLETITTALSPEELESRFKSAWTRHSSSTNVAASTPVSAGTGDSASASPASANSSGLSKTAQALENANEAVRQAEVAVEQADLTLEEKIQRAQRLAAAKRQQKLAEEAEDQKRKERERREAGKGIAELKRHQEEQEMKTLVEQRRKDKQDEIELRKRLKEQIAQDRAARNARSNVSYLTEGPHAPAPEQEAGGGGPSTRPVGLGAGASTVPKDYSGQARLQFRLPAGHSISHAFEPSVSLGDVRTFLITNNHVPFRQFSLSVAYPRRNFSTAEYESSLRDLGLVPSAALLVLPITTSSMMPGMGGSSGISTWINILLSYVMIPFTFIFSLIQRALPSTSGPTPPSTSTSASGSQPRPSTSSRSVPAPSTSTPTSGTSASGDSAASAAELRNRKGKGNKSDASKTSEGNIHRIRTHEEDSDEEKATWNGNSTQQM